MQKLVNGDLNERIAMLTEGVNYISSSTQKVSKILNMNMMFKFYTEYTVN